jgi:hypothetical protein
MVFSNSALEARISEVIGRLQRPGRDHAQLLARIKGEAASRRAVAGATEATQTGAIIGVAIESPARAMRRSLKLAVRADSRALARVSRLRERWSDGRFMAHAGWEEIERDVEAAYMRYTAGGFAGVAKATRAPDGAFLPS